MLSHELNPLFIDAMYLIGPLGINICIYLFVVHMARWVHYKLVVLYGLVCLFTQYINKRVL